MTLTVRGTRLAQTWNTGYEELAIDPSAGIAPTQLTDLAATPDQVVARLGTSNREEETKSSKSKGSTHTALGVIDLVGGNRALVDVGCRPTEGVSRTSSPTPPARIGR